MTDRNNIELGVSEFTPVIRTYIPLLTSFLAKDLIHFFQAMMALSGALPGHLQIMQSLFLQMGLYINGPVLLAIIIHQKLPLNHTLLLLFPYLCLLTVNALFTTVWKVTLGFLISSHQV